MILVGALVIVVGTLASTLGTVRSLIQQNEQGAKLQQSAEALRVQTGKIDKQTQALGRISTTIGEQTSAIATSSKEIGARTELIAATSKQIGEQTEEIQRKSTKLLADSAAISHLASESLRQVTSEGSFCYVAFLANDPKSDRRLLLISQRGKYPIYDVEISFYDPDIARTATLDNLAPNMLFSERIGNMAANKSIFWKWVTLPQGAVRKQYSVFISARNGVWSEIIELMKTEEGWQSAIRLAALDSTKVAPNDESLIFEQAAPNFPNGKNGHGNWVFDTKRGWLTKPL